MKTQGTDDDLNQRPENVIYQGISTHNDHLFGDFWTPFPKVCVDVGKHQNQKLSQSGARVFGRSEDH